MDLAWRVADLRTFYTDAGVLPRAALAELDPTLVRSAPSLSIHALSGSTAWQAALFALAAACAAGLAVGWRTRSMTIATWALLTSLHARMPLVLYRGDAVLRVMLFVAIWLPLGARFSVDARRRSGHGPASEVSGVACALAAVQLALVYLVGVGHKSGPTWRDGTAVYYALQLDEYATAAGRWIGARPAWSPALTYGTLAIEVVAPVLLFVPWRREVLRVIAVGSAFALHAGMLVTMRLDLFPWVMFACWALFLPPRFWDACLRTTRPVVRGDAHDRRWAPLLGAVLVAIAGWNLGELAEAPPRALGAVLRPLGLTQQWSMFSPDPTRDDGWIVATGRRADGTEVDPSSGDAPARERPRSARDLRWRKYLAVVSHDTSGRVTSGLLAWMCAREPSVEEVTLVFESETTMPPGEPPERDSRFLDGARCRAVAPLRR